MPEQGPLVQFLIVLCVIVGVERMVALVIKLLESVSKVKRARRDRASGNDQDYESKILINADDFRKLVASIVDIVSSTATHTKAIRDMIDHSHEVKIAIKEGARTIARAEKALDRFDN